MYIGTLQMSVMMMMITGKYREFDVCHAG